MAQLKNRIGELEAASQANQDKEKTYEDKTRALETNIEQLRSGKEVLLS